MLVLACCVTLARCSCPYMGAPKGEASSGCPFAGLRMPNVLEARNISQIRTDPDPGQMTAKGCTCTTSCGSTIDDKYKCDWCYVKGNCGKRGLKGHFDYCVYPDDKTFEAKTFQEKNEYFWSRVTADKKRGDYASPKVIFAEDIQTSFWDFKDEMPAGRVKGIHGVGAVCQFRLDIAHDSPYTGLFAPGPQDGFVRMGGATNFDKTKKGYPPGLGIKFARTGVQSGSTVALVSLDTAVFNFFKMNFSNHIAPPASVPTKALVKKFQQASQCPSQVGLSDMATWTQNGTKVADPKVPFKLFMVPSAEVQRPNTPKDIDDLMGELESFPVGTKIVTVYACAKGNGAAELSPTAGGLETACGEPFKLGDMVTTSACTTSAYGDAKFFIRHQPIEQDWVLRPDFLDQYDAETACGWSDKPTPTGLPEQCGT